MEFHTTQTVNPPKNLYPCLATITVVPHGSDTKSRRLSASSFGSNGGGQEDNSLSRVISGGRRKTSFGVVADRGDRADEARRRSFSGPGGVSGGDENNGKWYWRVQAGTTDNQLVLLPLTSPPNPVLTSPPQPLSHAMPAHSQQAAHAQGSVPGSTSDNQTSGQHEEGLGTKIKNLFRRSSAAPHHDEHAPTEANIADHNNNGDATSQATATTATAVDRVIDQSAQGEMLPSAQGNAMGATNVNANAETGWPGVIHGQHLGAIVVDLHAVDKSRITLSGGKKNEGTYVTIYVSPAGHGGLERVGVNHHESAKSGKIKFEFDKDWIGAKGEAELLHHYITTAVENLPAQTHSTADRGFPQAENFQLGGGTHGTSDRPNVPTANVALGQEIPPEQKVVG